MSRTFVRELSIFLLLAACILAKKKFSDTQFLGDGRVLQVNLTELHDTVPYIQQISIAASSNATFNVTNVSSNAAFIIFQIHVYQHNVTLSYDKDYLNKVSNRSVFGSNIGLFFRVTGNIVTQLFVKNDNVHDVKALLVAVGYLNRAPIPGGCNMEFNTEIAPYAKVQTRPAMVIVDVQPASMPLNDSVRPICEKNPVQHQMYQMFLTEQDFSMKSYFNAIISMLTVQNIMQNGNQVTSPTVSSPMRRVFSAYTGVGSVYVAVATYGKYSAAYVPAFSYACNPTIDPESCDVLPDTFSKFVCAVCFFLGFLFVIKGHCFIIADMMLPVFFTGTVVGYAIQESIAISFLIGLGFAVLWLLCQHFFCFCGSLTFSLTLGFFFASVAYFRSPDSFIILQNDWVFWTLFTTLALCISLAMVPLFAVTFVMTCAIFSSFMMVLPIDYYTGSGLKYIIINVVRRATVEDFNLAIVQPPVQVKDILLIVFWSFLALCRFVKQWLPKRSLPEQTPLLPSESTFYSNSWDHYSKE